jgi:MoaA/NifB/PqqE/SkfB family radical SAM enzyme
MPEILRYGRSKGVRLHVNTNATILREKQARMLIEDGAGKVTISFDGPDKATYEQMRKGASTRSRWRTCASTCAWCRSTRTTAGASPTP